MPRFSFYFIHGRFSGLLQLRRTRKRFSNCRGVRGGGGTAGLGNVPSVVVFIIAACVSFISLCLPLASCVSGAELTPGWLARKYPSPRSNPEECGWTEVVEWVGDLTRNISWLCDPDHVLGYHEAYNLALLLERYNKEAPCECAVHCSHQGYQIAVALVDRINTDGEFEPMKVKARDFAKEVRVSWFADHGCDDNVLIFYSLYDDELYISLGTKTEDIISDIELVRLNAFGDRHLTGEVVSTPRASNTNNNNNDNNNINNNNDSSTAAPTTSENDDDDVVNRQSTTIPTSTYTGLEALITEVHIAIMNGPSVSSQLIYAAVVPVLLVVVTVTMCFLANWCCVPLYGYDTDAIAQKNDKDDDDEEGEREERDNDVEKGKA